MDSLTSKCRILLFFLFCLPFISFLHSQSDRNSTLITPINRDLYHSSAVLMKEIEALVHRHPNNLAIDTFEAENKGYQAKTFGQHGRELITSELALRILSILSEEEFLPIMDRPSMNNTLNGLLIKVVPIENLNGRKLVEAGDLCERRNGRGVDLNRNWSVDWGKKEKDYDPYEENPGSAPFSEPETQIMRKLALSFEPHVWVNVHSGMEALFIPYDHKNITPEGAPSLKMRALVSELNHRHFEDRCMIGSGGGSVGYLAHGTATDYIYDVARVPMAFTFEIYGNESVSSKDCFRMFNPTDLNTFKRVLNDWSAALFTIFTLAPRQSGEANSETESVKLVSIDDYLDRYLMGRRNRYGKKMEVFDLGLQEIRSYFWLFMLSCVILLFMFCNRISKSMLQRP